MEQYGDLFSMELEKKLNQMLGNLSFGIYVWFSPQGNKITGKHKSVGVIILFCLSLPSNHCHQLQIFFCCFKPESEPSVLQMKNFLGPLVFELEDLWHQEIKIQTQQKPK